VHPDITSMRLTPQTACFSQGTSTPLTATVMGNIGGTPTDITQLTGPLNFLPQDNSVVTINSTVVPPIATAQLPGATIISTSTSNANSPAGVFFTCPPKSITLSVPSTGSTTNLTVNQNSPQAISASVLDINNKVITGLSLEFISTSLNTLNASSNGQVTATFPGSGTITAICQPLECNPAPLDSLGVNGNGLPVTSNPIRVTTPGTVNTVLFMASTGSQYFTNVDFSTGNVGSPVKLPYVPNSMIPDKAGLTMYFGSPSELMTVSMLNNTLTKEDASVKGVVVGVSNDGSELVISDAVHNLIYIYFTANGANVSFGGTATRAEFSPDDQNIYITGANTDGNNYWVYSNYDGWHSYNSTSAFTLSAPAPVDVAVTVPSIGAYFANPGATAGNSVTTAISNCPAGTVPPAAAQSNDKFYPPADEKSVATSRIAATFDSKHILGAYVAPAVSPAMNTATFTDLQLTLPSGGGANNPGACPPGAGFTFTTAPQTLSLAVPAATITKVLPDAGSQIAFVTYTSTNATAPVGGAVLPGYLIPATGTGTITSTPLVGATAPVAGIFSPDRDTFYAGTSGDNLVHIINVLSLTQPSAPPVNPDTGTIAPALPLCLVQDQSGNCTSQSPGLFATPNLLADKPRPTT
jgi:trimeric autotransporter adhesin